MEEEEGKNTKGTFGDSHSQGALDGLVGESSVHGQDLGELGTGKERKGRTIDRPSPVLFHTLDRGFPYLDGIKGVELL